MRVTSKGQVTIPIELRERAGLLPGTEVEFALRGETVLLTRVKGRGRGRAIVQHLRGSATSGLSTDEIMRLTRE